MTHPAARSSWRDGRVEKEMEMILRPCSISYDDQFRQLAELKDGWYDGIGKAVSTAAFEQAREALAKRPGAYLYPTVGGGIQAEWDIDGGMEIVVFTGAKP